MAHDARRRRLSELAWPWQLLSAALLAYIGAEKAGLLELAASPAQAGAAVVASDEATADGATETLAIQAKAVAAGAAARGSQAQASYEDARQLGSAAPPAGSGSSSGSCGTDEGTGSHSSDALFFMFSALVIGTVILHLTTLPRLHGLQTTVVLFVLGVATSMVIEASDLSASIGIAGRSYKMWMAIDPHFMLFAFLPVLLTGDAIHIDTLVARGVAKQCLYLAGPGVLVGASLTALFLRCYLPYNWSFVYCMTAGSILAATDPVAVVGLLKELGASPTLTVQIQGESLLNDGTSIVLFILAYDMLQGATFSTDEVIIFLVKTALCAAGLGVVIGYFFVFWIKMASNPLEHNAGLIQTFLTLCCAYVSYTLAEGVLHISGVLCTVAASLVLADKMWPSITDKGQMEHVWHMFEYIGNTLVFFLAGCLFGAIMIEMPYVEYLHCMVIYIAVTVIRAFVIFASRPILTYLGDQKEPVTFADAAVMTWGGLRGAVGLAFGIQVSLDKADGAVSDENGNRLFFYVGGIALLTLVINATTCPALVRFLGITATPEAKRQLLRDLHRQLEWKAAEKVLPWSVAYTMKSLLDESRQEIDALAIAQVKEAGCFSKMVENLRAKVQEQRVFFSGAELIEQLEDARSLFEGKVNASTRRLLGFSLLPFEEREEYLKDMVRHGEPDEQLVRNVNSSFLALVRQQYWQQIENEEFLSGTSDAELLLTSTYYAVKQSSTCVADFMYLYDNIEWQLNLERSDSDDSSIIAHFEHMKSSKERLSEVKMGRVSTVRTQISTRGRIPRLVASFRRCFRSVSNKQQPTRMQAFIEEGLVFNAMMTAIIILNGVFIAFTFSPGQQAPGNTHMALIVIELLFNVIFLFELLFKLIIFRLRYFCNGWNIFDFVLVVLGIVGIVIDFVAAQSASSEFGLLRMNRVFKILRVVRVFRLARFIKILRYMLLRRDASLELATQMQSITVLKAFVSAHKESQKKLAAFFGNEGNLCNVEQARCIMESMTQVYQAMTLAAGEAAGVDQKKLLRMNNLQESIAVTSELKDFVKTANASGVITSREADCLLHSFDNNIRLFFKQIRANLDGVDDGVGMSSNLTPHPDDDSRKPQIIQVSPMKSVVPISDDTFDAKDGRDLAVA